MSTPCIVATGTRDSWRGVPCKMDGYESWSGAALVDRIVRDGVAAAAAALVTGHGWECIGGDALTEPDDFLGGDVVTNATAPEILERHYAVYVIDVAGARLEVRHCDQAWREPAEFAPLKLPSWYPQLGERSFSKRRRPEAITRELQEQCRTLGIGWGPVCEALRRWVIAQLDLTGCAWIYLGGESDEHVRCLIDDTFLYAAIDSSDRCFTASDGKLRRFDIDNLDLAERMFRELGLSPTHALAVIGRWLTLAARHDDPQLRAEWFAGSKRWDIARSGGGMPMYLMPSGCLPTLLCWLF